MYILKGIRSSGIKIFKSYNNDEYKIAKFEFEVTQIVSDEIRLYKDNELIEEYVKPKEEEIIEYIIKGKSAYNYIHKVIKNDRTKAELIFKSESQRCDWVTLYEKKDDKEIQLDLYIKGVA